MYHVFRDVLQTIIETPTFCILTSHTAPSFDPSYFGGHVMSGQSFRQLYTQVLGGRKEADQPKASLYTGSHGSPLSPHPHTPLLPAQEVKGLILYIILVFTTVVPLHVRMVCMAYISIQIHFLCVFACDSFDQSIVTFWSHSFHFYLPYNSYQMYMPPIIVHVYTCMCM